MPRTKATARTGTGGKAPRAKQAPFFLEFKFDNSSRLSELVDTLADLLIERYDFPIPSVIQTETFTVVNFEVFSNIPDDREVIEILSLPAQLLRIKPPFTFKAFVANNEKGTEEEFSFKTVLKDDSWYGKISSQETEYTEWGQLLAKKNWTFKLRELKENDEEENEEEED